MTEIQSPKAQVRVLKTALEAATRTRNDFADQVNRLMAENTRLAGALRALNEGVNTQLEKERSERARLRETLDRATWEANQLGRENTRLQERVAQLDAAIEWVTGSRAWIDGRWFDERAFGYVEGSRVPPFWWRTPLREMCRPPPATSHNVTFRQPGAEEKAP